MSFYPPPLHIGGSSQPQKLSLLATGAARCPDTLDVDYADTANHSLHVGGLVSDRTHLAGRSVIVVGGGFSGLTTAWELIRCGLNVTVLDGSQRCDDVSPLGSQGRAYTRHLQDPSDIERKFNCEIGVNGFPVESKTFWIYLKHLFQALKPEHLPTADRDPVIHPVPCPGIGPTAVMVDGKLQTFTEAPPSDIADIAERVEEFFLALAVTDARGQTTRFEEVRNTLKTSAPDPADLDRVAFFWSTMIDRYDSKSLEDILSLPVTDGGVGLSPDQLRIYAAVGHGTGGFAPMLPLGFLTALRINIWEPGTLMQPPPGLTASGVLALLRLACDKANVIGYDSEHWGALDFRENTTVTRVLWNRSTRQYDLTILDVDAVISTISGKHVVVATNPSAFQARLNLDRPTSTADGSHGPVFEPTPDMNPRVLDLVRDLARDMGTVHQCPASRFYSVIRKPWYVAPGETTPVDPDWPTVDGEPVKALVSDTLARTTMLLDPFPESPYALAMVSEAWGADASKLHAAQLYIPSQIPYASPSTPGISENEFYAQSFDGYSRPSNLGTTFRFAERLRENMDSSLMSAQAWELEPLVHAGATLQAPGDYQKLSRLAFQNHMCMDRSYRGYAYGPDVTDDKPGFVLSGDGCSFLGGWVEGALSAGLNAAIAVIAAMGRISDIIPEIFRPYAAPSRFRGNGAALRATQACSFYSLQQGAPQTLNYATIRPEKSTPLTLAASMNIEMGSITIPERVVNFQNSTFIFVSQYDNSLGAIRLDNSGAEEKYHIASANEIAGPSRAVVYKNVLYVFYKFRGQTTDDQYDVHCRYLDTSTTPWTWKDHDFGSLKPQSTFSIAPVATPFGLYLFTIIPPYRGIQVYKFIDDQWTTGEQYPLDMTESIEAVEIDGRMLVFCMTQDTPRKILCTPHDGAWNEFGETTDLKGLFGESLEVPVSGVMRASTANGNIAFYYPASTTSTVAATFGWNAHSSRLTCRTGPNQVIPVRPDVQASLALLAGDLRLPRN
jgi:tryptophan 2-monooxygenase